MASAGAAMQANSETAQDVAAALLRFKEYVPEYAAEITSTVSKLFSISSALLHLETVWRDPRNYRVLPDYDEDQRVVIRSLEITFKDCQRFFGMLDQSRFRSRHEAYYHVWAEMQGYFAHESRNKLLTRLEYFQDMLTDLANVVDGLEKWDQNHDELMNSFEELLDVQQDRLAEEMGNLQVGAPRQQKSWERKRPGPQNIPEILPRHFRHTPRPRSPNSPGPAHPHGYGGRDYGGGYGGHQYHAPDPPMVPPSPSTTTATASTISSSSPLSPTDHWLPTAFGQNRPTTTFKITGSESACYGENQHGASHKLRSEHDELLSLPFESGYLELRFYLRHRDRRARIWCRMERQNIKRTQCMQNVTSLRIMRRDSCLQLCKMDSKKRLHLWANLRFTSYERMLLFHSAFLALKAQDEGEPVKKLDDHILDGEIHLFSATISDGGYEHALQVYRDSNSRGIRMTAAAMNGSLKRCPIWVAFITYKVQARSWIVRPEARKVHLMDLTRYVFAPGYIPQLGPNGEHEIHFKDHKDASKFMQLIDDLCEERI